MPVFDRSIFGLQGGSGFSGTSGYSGVGVYDQGLDTTDSPSFVNISTTKVTSSMINNTDSDTNEIDSVTWAGGNGLLIATCVTDANATAVWRLEGITIISLSVNALFTSTKDGAGTYNVYFEGGAIKLQNKVGDNKVVKLGFYGI